MNMSDFESVIFALVRCKVACMPRSKRPEQILKNAMRSRWRGSIFAWILKTNPEKASSSGATTLPASVRRLRGAGAKPINESKNGSTPKFVSALPKKTGLI